MKILDKKYGILVLVLIVLMVLTSCTESKEASNEDMEIPDYIILSGLGEEDLEVSIDEIKDLEKVNQDVTSISSSGETKDSNVTGGLLEELLQKHNKSQKDYQAIRFEALDGYSIEVPNEVLNSRDVILTYEMDGDPIYEDSKPLRVVVPEERAMYWVKSLVKIELLEGEIATTEEEANKIMIFENVVDQLQQEDYEYYDNMDKAIKGENLLKEFDIEGESIFLKAADGLEKNESNSIFSENYIKITGEDSPLLTGPDMPKGMTVKDILYFSSGEVSFISVNKAMETFEQVTNENITGIKLEDIIEEINLPEGESYIFAAKDGYSVEVSKDDIEKGIIYLGDDDEEITISFPGLEKNTTVKDLLSIELKSN